ncbi:hypothetical protein ACLOJK_000136 [Asimina triloba]
MTFHSQNHTKDEDKIAFTIILQCWAWWHENGWNVWETDEPSGGGDGAVQLELPSADDGETGRGRESQRGEVGETWQLGRGDTTRGRIDEDNDGTGGSTTMTTAENYDSRSTTRTMVADERHNGLEGKGRSDD